MPLPTMLTETSNNSVSAPQRDSPDVKAANKERQTIISTVPLVSCCYTEIVACMCKQSTPEKLHNKQFKAVVRNAETWRTRAYGGLDSNLLSSYGVWLPRFCLLRVCVYVGNREGERKGESVWVHPHVETKHDPYLPPPTAHIFILWLPSGFEKHTVKLKNSSHLKPSSSEQSAKVWPWKCNTA